MPERMSEDMTDGMPDRMSEDMPDRISNRMPNRMLEDLPDRMSNGMNWMSWWGSLEAKHFIYSFVYFPLPCLIARESDPKRSKEWIFTIWMGFTFLLFRITLHFPYLTGNLSHFRRSDFIRHARWHGYIAILEDCFQSISGALHTLWDSTWP